ncbi:hypothetical protein IAC76_02380 [Spirochaetes bacterium]|uniref:Lipoprotein n=1 Tax=Candidatus Scatousia excrementipullorum TaxID=2840936 RepID=A0A9D9DNA0_9BACT|nr:hypothetical protein [Candidatus Scatousia excrementipullorum]
MRKFLIALSVIILCGCSVNAQCNYSDLKCPQNYKTANGFAKFMGSVTGANFIARKAGESIIKKSIKNDAEGDFDVKLESFSAADLAAGRFKSLSITGKNIVSDDVYLSYLNLKTICDYNYIVLDKKNNTATFKEDFGMTFGAVMTESDINNSMKNKEYQYLIDEINSLGKSIALFNIQSAKVKIKNNKFMYVIKIAFPMFGLSKSLVITSDINVHNGKIIFTHTDVMNDYVKIDLSKITYLLNQLNPLNFSLRILENKDADMKIQEAVIKNDKIYVNGIITVDKDVVTECKE